MLVLVRVSCSNGSARNPGGLAIHQDKHQAPTHLSIRPLSLQNAGDARVPVGVITLFDWKNSPGVARQLTPAEQNEKQRDQNNGGVAFSAPEAPKARNAAC